MIMFKLSDNMRMVGALLVPSPPPPPPPFLFLEKCLYTKYIISPAYSDARCFKIAGDHPLVIS